MTQEQITALRDAAGRAKADPSEPIQWFRYRDLRFIFKGRSPAIDLPTCDFIVACSPENILALLDELERYKSALREIACYGEGDAVTGSFDEPCAARVARAALEKA